jgi:CBS domain-containing protein
MPATPSTDLPELLRKHRVFGRLDGPARAELTERFARESFAAGSVVASGATMHERLGLVLSGRVALRRAGANGNVVVLAESELFGSGAMLPDAAGAWTAVTEDDAEVAFLTVADVVHLCAEHDAMALLLAPPASSQPRPARGADPHLGLMTTPVRELLRRPPVTLPPTATIVETAQTMRDQRVSSVMLVEKEHLFGLVTDRDLRNRALAARLDADAPVLEIATVAPLAIDIAKPAFDALLLMARHNIHHVPVLDGQRVAGMITATDLTEQHSTSAVYLVGEIHKQAGVDGLVVAAARVKQLQRNLAAAGASAYSTGHIVTAITDALTTRLLQLGEAQLGPAPVDYVWVAAGSQARSEQTAKSDQDNCMLLDDRYDAASHGAYFKALSNFVNDGLDACGYIYCPGEMMARTDEWRQPRRRWAEYFRRWTDEPDPKALMLTCVFFDLRPIDGQSALLEGLRRDVLRQTRDNRIFLAYMVGNALTHRPPLTLFGGISTVRSGERRDTVDLKHSGIVPIVDLARIYALAGGHEAVNTHDRLAIAAQSGEISEQGARDLRDALEFMATLRIRHQAAQTAQGQAADNFLSLGELSNFERGQLKDAFGVVQTLQNVLAQRYRAP